MAIRVRRGTDAQRLTVVLQDGEIAWTTDTQEFYVGDGVTLGGVLIGPAIGSFVPTTRNLTINGTTQDLSADRTWSVGTVTSVSGTGTVSGLTLSGTVTGSGNITLGGALTLTSLNVTTALGYTPYDATNPAGYITSAALAGYLTSATAATTYYPIPTGTTSDYIRGDGSIAAFPSIPSITPSALTKVDDTNVTLTLGGTPSTALLQAVSLTLGWTGTLADARIASASNWNTAYTNRITSLTTTGSSGAATLLANVLNIPNYTLAGLGGVPTSRNITINGTTQDLSADRTWSVGTVTSVGFTAGTGISLAGTNPITGSGTVTITNSAPDQTVVLTAGTGIGVAGTYPNFTISNTDPTSGVTLASAGGTETLVNDGTGPALATKGLTAGTGISLSSTATDVTVTNSAPDQVVALTAGTGIGITGAYPNFTITNSSPSSGGTVTSVGLALPTEFAISGSPVTGSGTLTGSWNNQTANTVLAGPTSGGAATPTFRALVSGDIPNISATYLTVANAALNYQPLDSDLTTIAGLTPANDDIIQRKAGAWTNRTIAQYYADLQPSVKDDVYFTIPFLPAVLSPADATTYYIGAGAIAPSTTATNQDMSLGYDFTVIGAVIMASGNTAAGTTENSTMSIRNTTTSTSTTIGNFQTNGSTTVIISTTITGLSINVNAADLFCLQWLAPTWATNPTAVAVRTILICKRR